MGTAFRLLAVFIALLVPSIFGLTQPILPLQTYTVTLTPSTTTRTAVVNETVQVTATSTTTLTNTPTYTVSFTSTLTQLITSVQTSTVTPSTATQTATATSTATMTTQSPVTTVFFITVNRTILQTQAFTFFISSSTVSPVGPIAGFPIEGIIVGLMLGFIFLAVARRKVRDKNDSS